MVWRSGCYEFRDSGYGPLNPKPQKGLHRGLGSRAQRKLPSLGCEGSRLRKSGPLLVHKLNYKVDLG